MFIKIKKIGGNEYAYLAENRRVWKKVKQKTKKYLGKVFRFDIVNVAEFYDFHGIDPEEYLEGKNVREILLDLISMELYKHGFNKVKNRKWLWNNGEIFVDLRDNKFYTSRGSVALGFNDGFLCKHCVSKLMNFRVSSEEDGILLAKAFVEAGIDVPKEIFIGVFGKLSYGKELFEYDE